MGDERLRNASPTGRGHHVKEPIKFKYKSRRKPEYTDERLRMQAREGAAIK